MVLVKSAAYGAILWFVGARACRLLERFLKPSTPPAHTLALYAASVPAFYASIAVLPLTGFIPASEVATATLAGLGVASVLDGTALVFAPRLYSSSRDTGNSGAFILWAAGWTCLSALVLSRKASS